MQFIKRLIPALLYRRIQPYYHGVLSFLAALYYGFPSRHLTVIGITGTNGKSTTVELLSRILEEAGYKTASFSSIRSRIAGKEEENTLKMTMPGRFILQQFLRNAVRAGCTYAVIEVTSEGIKQFRHKHIRFHMAILTNVTPEHIESHGSFEAYRRAKGELFYAAPVHVLNADDDNSAYFANIPSKSTIYYRTSDFPSTITISLPGAFNRENAMAALTAARALGIPDDIAKRGLERVSYVPGRLEVVSERPFRVVVDYAHTPDALEKVYQALKPARLICVLGSAGGGRDTWKRPEMGRIAGEYCADIFFTNEDPYDEDPRMIVEDVARGLGGGAANTNKPSYSIFLDRREAIHAALRAASAGDTVIITGKGCESCIMGPHGSRMPWDDRKVVREELQSLSNN